MIEQRSKTDCVVASLAMFLGRSYEAIAHYTSEDERISEGVTNQKMMDIARVFGVELEFVEELEPGQAAMLTVKSLELPGDLHLVYWDGEKLFDPAREKKYDEVPNVEEIIILRTP